MVTQWKKLTANISIATMLSVGTQMALAQNHEHSHETAAPAQLTLNNGQKWATDKNLRLGMSRIRDALAKELPAIHSGKAIVGQYNSMAKKIDVQIAFMVQNCKLEPKTDAMLHLLLAEIIAGADAMRKNDRKEGGIGAEKIVQALEEYARYFDHPGWQGLEHAR